MRTLLIAFSAVLFALPAGAQQGQQMKMKDDPDKAVAGGGVLPAGWSARADRDVPLTNVKFSKMGEGWHFTLGPATVVYRETDKASGNYHVAATFTQTKAPMHPEAYGVFIGGSDLKGDGQKYSYFLVRGDGRFLVKRRNGANATNVTEGWTENAAVNKVDANGKATNEFGVGVSGGKVSFTVNGKEVYSGDAANLDATGIVGLRVNHNLDVHVTGFAIHKM